MREHISAPKHGLTIRLLPTAQPSLTFGEVLLATLVEIQDGFAGKVGL